MANERFDAGDEKSVKINKDVLSLMRADEAALFAKMLDQYGFRKFLYDIIFDAQTGIQHTPFSSDPHQMAVNVGRLSIAQEMFVKVLTLRPEAITIMQREAVGRQNKGSG